MKSLSLCSRSQSRQRLGTTRDGHPISGEIGYEDMT